MASALSWKQKSVRSKDPDAWAKIGKHHQLESQSTALIMPIMQIRSVFGVGSIRTDPFATALGAGAGFNPHCDATALPPHSRVLSR
ncbi:hypothetical protein EYF80_023716 [Liparis tanakae]|uniref:Uncharacterized protein n=1 Tax=Liparis tanakae TaxID=230148 RepID=A0A4Z2HJU4_9TELE|nr:hypothetical protein EYF80_023716 [Liparis tanakae]